MFDFGFWELMLVAVIGLLVLGPERLPRVAKLGGQYLGRIRNFANDFKSQIEHEADLTKLGEVVDDQRKVIRQLQQDVRESTGVPSTETIDDAIKSGRYERDDSAQDAGDEPVENDTDRARK